MADKFEMTVDTMGRRKVPLVRLDGVIVQASAAYMPAPARAEMPSSGPYGASAPWELDRNGEKLTQLAEAVLSIQLRNDKCVISYFDEGFIRCTGYSRELLYGKRMFPMLPPEMPEEYHNRLVSEKFKHLPESAHIVLILTGLPVPELPSDSSTGYYDAFISYKRKDSASFCNRALPLIQNHRCWFDTRAIESGADFENRIERGIANSSKFIALVSKGWCEFSSPGEKPRYCEAEMAEAIALRKPILVIFRGSFDELAPKLFKRFPELEKLNCLNFQPDVDDSKRAFAEIRKFLAFDQEFFGECRYYCGLAWDWGKSGKEPRKLLRNGRATTARVWLERSQDRKIGIPQVTKEFIRKSNAAYNKRKRLPVALTAASLILAIGAIFYGHSQHQYAEGWRVKSEENEIRARANLSNAMSIRARGDRFEEPCEALSEGMLRVREIERSLSDAYTLHPGPVRDNQARTFIEGIERLDGFVRSNLSTIVYGNSSHKDDEDLMAIAGEKFDIVRNNDCKLPD